MPRLKQMSCSMQSRKQEAVRDAICEAVIEIFGAKGFDETTVEEVANAAGMSRRSFFRYFHSKDDLLAQDVVNFGNAIIRAIEDCPSSMSPRDVIRETIARGSKYAALQSRTRQIIGISVRSTSARRAHQSRMIEVEDGVAEAFAARKEGASKDDVESRMFAGVTLLVMNLTLFSWFNNEREDLSKAYRLALASVTDLLFENGDKSSESKITFNGRKEFKHAVG